MSFAERSTQNFIDEQRYLYLVKGLGNTVLITIFAVLLGILLGFLVAIIRTTHERNSNLKILDAICNAYLTVIRGTPVMVQLLIMFYVIFASSTIDRISRRILSLILPSSFVRIPFTFSITKYLGRRALITFR